MEESAKVAGEDEYIKEMHTLCQAENEAGAKINDLHFITKLLDSFPKSWDPVITPMYGEKDLSKVLMNLTVHAEWMSICKECNGKKQAEGASSVNVLEATVVALQVEITSFKSSNSCRGTTNPCTLHSPPFSDRFQRTFTRPSQFRRTQLNSLSDFPWIPLD